MLVGKYPLITHSADKNAISVNYSRAPQIIFIRLRVILTDMLYVLYFLKMSLVHDARFLYIKALPTS